MVPPFLPVSLARSFTLLTEALATLLIFLGVAFAAFLALVVVFLAEDFAAVAAFLALAGAFLAAALALVVVFLATDFTLFAAFAAAIALPAIASLKPAFCKDAVEDLANFATLSIFAATNFFADAALTLGSADKLPDFESVPLAAIDSPYGNGKQRSHFNTLIQLKSTTVELIAYKPTHRTYERGSWW